MWRFLRILIVLVILVGLLIGGALWGLNAYVQSQAFHDQVRAKASELAGVPVAFSDVQWDIGRGITVIGLRLENEAPETRPAVLSVPRIHLKYDWSALWNWRFDIRELTFKDPEFIITQKPDGAYLLPFNPGESEQPEEAAPASALSVVLRSFNLDKGRFEVIDNTLHSRLKMEGVRVEANHPASGNGDNTRLQGLIKTREVALWETLYLHVISSPFNFQDNLLTLGALEAETYGGTLNGSWEQNFNEPSMPYNLKLNAEGVNVARLMAEALERPGLLSGRLKASTVWIGPATSPLDVTGHGTAEIINGQVIDLPFFRQLAGLLGNVSALAKPDLTEARMEFKVAKRQLDVTALSLKSALFELGGTATVTFELGLSGKLKLALNPQIAKQIPGEVRAVMEKRADGYLVVPLKLSGTVDDPKVGLAVDAGMMNRAVDRIFNLFGPKSRDKEKATPPPAAPPATPAPPAAP